MTKKMAAVFAHPDDDTYGIAGSVARHVGSDLEIAVVMTTSGESGQIADPSLATRETLGAVREEEDRASWDALGFDPEIRFLRYPDGGVSDVPQESLVAVYLANLQEARPDVVVTFGPEGITGHPDHVAVGAAATAAFHAARAAGADGFRRLLYCCVARSTIDRFNALLRERGLPPIDPTQPFQPRAVADEAVGMMIDCSDVYDRKLEALRRHRTQSELEDVPFELWRELVGSESFVVAYPEREPGAPVLTDLFEGLEDP